MYLLHQVAPNNTAFPRILAQIISLSQPFLEFHVCPRGATTSSSPKSAACRCRHPEMLYDGLQFLAVTSKPPKHCLKVIFLFKTRRLAERALPALSLNNFKFAPTLSLTVCRHSPFAKTKKKYATKGCPHLNLWKLRFDCKRYQGG